VGYRVFPKELLPCEGIGMALLYYRAGEKATSEEMEAIGCNKTNVDIGK
jgi:hypothetical protein